MVAQFRHGCAPKPRLFFLPTKKKTTKASKTTKPATKPKPHKKASAQPMPKMADVATGKQEFVKVARTKNKTKNKTKPRTWVIVYKLMTGSEVNTKKADAPSLQ